MQIILNNLGPLVSLLVWVLLWALGGIWIARSAFVLRRNEQVLTGLAVGLVLENWLANLLGHFLPVPLTFWVAAMLVLLIGLAFTYPQWRKKPLDLFKFPVLPVQWVLFGLLAVVFIAIGRGMALLDDFQNLPTASMIATGDIPPHFALDPDVSYGYHYFTLLLAAQIMHIADVFVWTALDMARGFSFALGLMLSGLFVRRVTGSKLAGVLGGMMSAFAGGTRWLLLLLPTTWVVRLGTGLNFLGSGAQSGSSLLDALHNPWAAAGMGPVPFPFAFVNGFNPTNIITYHAGAGGLVTLLSALLLLLHNRWRGWRAWAVMIVILAALGLGNEVSLVVICLGIVLVILVYMLTRRTWRLPQTLWRWFVAAVGGGLISLFQGGVITSLALNSLSALLPGDKPVTAAYHTFHFTLFWPPKVLSSHLGYLALDNPKQIVLALIEIGPVLLFFPVVLVWMVKAFRFQRWYECFLGTAAVASLGLFVVELSGAAGLTALTRIQNLMLSVLTTFCVPAVWFFARRRGAVIRISVAVVLFVIMFGGMVLFGISLAAIPHPVTTEDISTIDASMTAAYWNQLEEGALVFDPDPYRGPIVFGRANRSSDDFFRRKPEWEALHADPNPAALNAAGYRYLYVDDEYWRSLTEPQRDALQDECVQLVYEVHHKRLDYFGRLLDVSGCY